MCLNHKKVEYKKFCPICNNFHIANKYQTFKDICPTYLKWDSKKDDIVNAFEANDLVTIKLSSVKNYSTTFIGDILKITSVSKDNKTFSAAILVTKNKKCGNIIDNLTLYELKSEDFDIVPEVLMNSYYGGKKNEY